MGGLFGPAGGDAAGDDPSSYLTAEEMEGDRDTEATMENSTLRQVLVNTQKAKAYTKDTLRRLQVIKNVIEDKKEKCDGKWKTVEFPFEEVANLEKVLKNMEAKMSYVIENLTDAGTTLRAESEVMAIGGGSKAVGDKELAELLDLWVGFQRQAIKSLETRLKVDAPAPATPAEIELMVADGRETDEDDDDLSSLSGGDEEEVRKAGNWDGSTQPAESVAASSPRRDNR